MDIDINKIIAEDTKALDAMAADVADIMVPREQYRAMLLYILQLQKDALTLAEKVRDDQGTKERNADLIADLQGLKVKHGF